MQLVIIGVEAILSTNPGSCRDEEGEATWKCLNENRGFHQIQSHSHVSTRRMTENHQPTRQHHPLTLWPIKLRTMKGAVENTKATIKSIQADFETALTKAINDIDAGRIQAELKLNAMSRSLDHIVEKKRKRSTTYSTALLTLLLWTFVIVSLLLLVAFVTTLDLTIASAQELLAISINTAYAFPVQVAFFTATALYSVAAFCLHRSSRTPKANKPVLVDKGCQTDVSSSVIAPRAENEGEKEDGSISSEDSVVSLTNSSDEGEVVHLEVYVEPMKLVENQWKRYDSLKMSILTIDGRNCMVFRNDIGVIHFNLPIAQGMDFETTEDKGQSYIRFASIEDKDKEIKVFMLKVAPKMLSKVHSKWVELAT